MKTKQSAVFITAVLLLSLSSTASPSLLNKKNEPVAKSAITIGVRPCTAEPSSGKVVLTNKFVRHQVQLRYHAAVAGECRMIVLDACGKQLLMLRRTISKGQNLFRIDLHRSLPAGNYQLSVTAEETEVTLPFTKQ